MAATRNNSNLSFGRVNIAPVAATIAENVPTIDPLLALTGRVEPDPQFGTSVTIPTISIPLTSQPQPVIEPTLPLRRTRIRNGVIVRKVDDISIRPDLMSVTDFKPIYTENGAFQTNFGRYVSDLYTASVLRDTVRRYMLFSLRRSNPNLENILTRINQNVTQTLSQTQNTIANLDQLISVLNDVKSALNVRETLGSTRQTQPVEPLFKLPNFYTNQMLFSAQAYNSFADTKIMYQLISDLSNIIAKCSFNLLDNFQDLERRQSVVGARPGSVVDPISIDKTYGTGLRYDPRFINRILINNTGNFNSILSVLPVGNGNRIKFLINLLSKEYRVSYSLGGSGLLNNRLFFGFSDRGNPFPAINGTVPNDIFLPPVGENSLTSLFYEAIEGNAVVLPFEARQVSSDGETVFIPGTEYFGDGILNNRFTNFISYRDNFSTVYTNVRTSYDAFLFNQDNMSQNTILRNIVSEFKRCQDQFRPDGVNSDSTSVLIYALVLFATGNSLLKYEVYKLLLLLILITDRQPLTRSDTRLASTTKYRELLFGELSSYVTEDTLDSVLTEQIRNVKTEFENYLSNDPNSNTSASTNWQRAQVQVALEQFSRLDNSLKDSLTGPNLFKSITFIGKLLFNTAKVSDEQLQHLIPDSSLTRFNALSISGTLLLIYEIFCSLVQQFSTDAILNKQVQSVRVSNLNFQFRFDKQTIDDFVNGTARVDENILAGYRFKLNQEDGVIKNILDFFRLMNERFSQVRIPDSINLNQLNNLGVDIGNDYISLGYIRTAKNTLKHITDKLAAVNQTSQPNLEFYIPSGKYVSNSNWAATKLILGSETFRTIANKKIISVGIPNGFLETVLGARLARNSVVDNILNRDESDVINIKIYKLNKNSDRLIFNPIEFKFDMSLFSYGFDGLFPIILGEPILAGETYNSLREKFKFYDFDESADYRRVNRKVLTDLLADPFYRTRNPLAIEVVTNLLQSFILENYINVLTGLSYIEETFVEYTQTETQNFSQALTDYIAGDVTKLGETKFMFNSYQELLNIFSNADEKKMMLTLCNDISKTVLRPKIYDRIFHMIVDVNDFSINEDQTRSTASGNEYLQNLRTTGQVVQRYGRLYKVADNFDISQYFINVEIIE